MRIESTNTGGGDVVPPMIASLIERIKNAPNTLHFVEELNKARTLQTILAKTELYRWTPVLNRCDDILEEATSVKDNVMQIDACHATKNTTISVLRFTALLFECSSTRRIYASTDRLLALLESSDLDIIAEVLRLLQTISKRSKFLTQRLGPQEQTSLVHNLTSIAQCWGGKLRNVKMTDCVSDDVKLPSLFPFVYSDGTGELITIDQLPATDVPLLSIVSEKCANMDAEHRYCVLARLRMLRNFHLAEHRMQCLIVRLLSISTLIHCRCQTDESQISALLYPGFIEETVALLRTDRAYHNLVDPIQTEALRTLTSIVSLEKTMMVNDILLSLGASSYHGFLAAFTRLIVDDLKRNELGTRGKPTVALGTALFSFIYHLSSVDPGGESLVSSGLTQTLLSVLEYKELAIEQISFATRCSRIIDIFTSIDVTVFNNCRGMAVFIERLVHEVDECRKEQPFVIDTSGDVDDDSFKNTPVKTPLLDRRCNQQRSGLIKGLLTFIKRAIQENHLQDSTRHIMEGGLPEALIHIISNAEFYSDSIYHHALQLVTNFIYQEPTQLTHLQTKHVPYVMLQSMLRKELPNSRDVISHLGNVFTALCLNEQGLRQFKSYRPFDHVFKVVLSLKFIATMKKKRSEMSDAAAGVGSAMDDLLRHQPTLKPLMLDSIITALDMLLQLGQNPPANTKIVMALSRSASKAACQNICSGSGGNTPEADRPPEEELGLFSAGEDDRSDDDEEEAELSMDEMSTIRPPTVDKMGLEMDCASEANDGSRVLPLGDYLLIFAKIFETVLTQANATDMVDGFVEKNGVEKLLALSQLPSLSAELATSHFGQSVAAIMQCILQNGGAGNRLMKSFLEMFGERAGMLLESVPEEGGSYMAHLGRKPISDAIAFINGAIPIISHLSKSSFGGGQYSTDRRSRVHEAWLTDSGKQLHIKLRRVSRYLAWESTLIKMIEPTKVVASTQTDSITDFVPMVEEHTERITLDNVTSEAVDVQLSGTKPAWESASISKAEVDFWRENKPLADMVIKANKSTSDFLSLLSRSCYVPARRNRRYEATGSPMGKAASKMADQVFAAIYRDLKWTSSKAADSSMEFGRLNEVLTQLVVVLFDERSYPFHGMLQRFYTSGCHQVFCDILNDKLSTALDKPPTQPLEMVFTTWFRLAEKLAVKQKMVKSMYRQSVILSRHFNPETYSKLVHSDFFRCLSVLFSRLSAEGVDLRNYQSLCESAISVYKEVAQTLVPSDGESTPRDGGARVEAGQAAQIGEAQIRQMLDLNLGFNRDDVTQALIMFPTANEATEWLINRPAQQEMNQQNITVDVGAVNPGEEGDAGGVSSGGSSARASVGLEEQAAQDDQIDTPIIKPLSELAIDKDVSVSQACIELMPLCKRLMEVGSDLVFSCADMVIGVVDSLDENWKKNQLISKIMIQEILEMARTVIDDPQENLATVLATRIHFVCLLFEHISEDYLEILESHPMVTVLQNLLRTIHEKFELAHMHNALLPPVVLWFDLYDKCHRTQKRRQLLEKLAADKQLRWTYLGDDNEGRYPASRSGKKWIPYAPSAQTQLNAAFFSGKSSVTVKSARDREFTVEFASLKQKENDAHKCPVNLEIPDGVDISLADIVKMESENVWSADESKELLISVVRLLHKGVVHHTAAHSLLSFTARLTRDHTCAKNFLQQGGVVAMLQLRSSHSPCTSALVSLILRQCIDTDDLLRAVYEKTIRQMTSVNSTPLSEYLGIQDNKPKEWYETLKKLAPLAVKNPDVYVTTMEKCTKMASNGSTIQFTGKNLRSGTETSVDMDQIVSLVLREVLSGEWPSENEVPLGHGRMLSRGTLLTLLAELVKTYGGAAGLICGAKEAEQSIIHLLLEKYIDGKDKETMKALKVLIAVLAGCNHSPKAQESLVADVKSSLALIGSSSPAVICTKVDEMCSLMVMMVDSCPSPVVPPGSAHRTPSQTPPNPVMRLFHKKKICNDLVRTITYLQLSHKDSIDTVNQVLKTLETMLRNMNSPAASTQSNHDNVLPSGVARGLLRGLLNEADEGGEDEDPMDDHHHFLEGAERMFREHMDMERAPRNMERELEDLRAQVRALEQAPALANHEHDQDLDDEDREGDDEDDDLLGADEDMLGEEEEEGADDAGEDSAESVSTMEDGGDAEALNEAEEIAEAAMRDEMEQEDAQQGGSVGEGGDETMDVGGDGGPGGEPNEEDTEEEEEDDNDDDDEDDEDDYENDDYHYEDDQPEIFDGMYDDIERPGIVMNGVDDWDIFPTPFGHLGQGAREARQRPAAAEAQHPLLVRPLHIADTAPHVLAHGNSSLIPDYRVVLNRGDALTLTRQNAIRRMGAASRVRAIAQGGAQIFDRLFDMQVRDRHGTVINLMDPSFEREERHLRTPASVPSALDRLTGGIDLLEPLSSLFVSVLCNSLVTRQAKEKVDKEAAAAAAEKEKEKAAAATTSSADSAVTTTAEETVSVVVPPLPEVALPAWDLGQRVDLNRRTQDEEAMDVTEPDAPQQQEDVSMDEAPPNSSAATVASSVDGEAEEVMEQHDVAVDTTDSVAAATVSAAPAAEEEAMQATVAVAEPAVDQPSSSTETAAVAENRVPEEFRAVLGDIVLPNGVDPAFLAALPEEMRGEVIRDHERQQRAQRVTAAVPAAAPEVAGTVADGGEAAAASTAEAATPVVAAAVVEPIDQDFLAALPPELQEEILQQHERAVREAEEAARRANAPTVPPPVAPELDGAAVIASLPPGERAQVLAEMDDAELQRLPEAMQAEARRARTHMQNLFEPIHRNVMRIHNLYVRGGAGVPGRLAMRAGGGPGSGRGSASTSTVGNLAGKTSTASAQAVQLLDRESILTLCGLFLVDNRLSISRLQKVIKTVCSHAGSCDFVVWCLQALFEKASESGPDEDEIVSICPSWLESITVAGVGHNERTLRIAKNASKVSVHPLVADTVCRNVLDALITLAKSYPGHFVPAALRSTETTDCRELPSLEQFWQLLQSPSGKALFGKESSLDTRPPSEQLKTSALARLIHFFDNAAVQRISLLQDKLLKLLSTVVQTLPNDSTQKLGMSEDSPPLKDEMRTVVNVLAKGTLTAEGFADGRTLLVEAMRALPPSTSEFVYDQLCVAIQEIGLELQPQIETLLTELGDIPDGDMSSPSSSSNLPSTSGRVQSMRLAGDGVVVDGDAIGKLKMNASSCRELRLPSVTALTDVNGAQSSLLSSLQTLTKVRDTMRQMKEDKRKVLEDERKKAAENQKKLEEERKKRDEEAKAKTSATAESSSSIDVTTTESTAADTSVAAGSSGTGDAETTQEAAKTDEATPVSSATEEAEVAPIDDPSVVLRSLEQSDSRLSQRLDGLADLWNVVSTCLLRLGKSSDPHAVLALQPAAEAFFLVHAVAKSADHEHPDTVRMIEFAEKHREVLNQVLRQNSQALSPGGPFAILTQFPKLLDFDVKRKYFRKELTKMDGEREYRRADVNVQVRRSQLFSDSFRELFRLRPSDWKKRFYIVFQGEEGQDAGGLLREWFSVITREIFNPNYALFITAPGDMVTYMINKASHINPEHLDYFKFVGRLIAKAIYDNKLLDCYFTRAFYKHILNLPVRYQDIESEDPAFFKSLEFLLNNPINDLGLDLTFSLEVEEFGVRSIRDLKPDGRSLDVTDENKVEYVNLVCQMKMTGSIRKQLDAFLTGFYEVIPRQLISMFNEQELELLISGLPDVDIDDLAQNTEYKSYTKTSPQIQWFWRALRSFEQEDRAKFLQFVTGTSKVPLQGFSSLEGMNGVQKFSIHQDSRGGQRLPAAHTCFNQLDLPQYDSYETLRDRLLVAIRECTEGFGFA